MSTEFDSSWENARLQERITALEAEAAELRSKFEALESAHQKTRETAATMVSHRDGIISSLRAENTELRSLLIECRSSVKFDQTRYERMALDYARLGQEGAQVHASSESEAQRLHVLLAAIKRAVASLRK